MRIPTHREPTHPGEMLREEFLIPMGLTQKALSEAIHVPYRRINAIVNERKSIEPKIALRLSRFFGVSEDFWLNLQLRWDLYNAKKVENTEIESIQPFVFWRRI